MNKKIQIAKFAVTTIVSIGTGKIISSIIQNNTNPDSLTDKVVVTAGGFALGSMVADVTRQYTDAKIDWLVGLAQKTFNNK